MPHSRKKLAKTLSGQALFAAKLLTGEMPQGDFSRASVRRLAVLERRGYHVPLAEGRGGPGNPADVENVALW